MKWTVLSVFDVKVGAFMRPMFAPSVGAGSRAFSDEVNRSDSEMFKHPEDYVLYCLGVFDDELGSFVLEAQPRTVATAGGVKI